MPVPVPSRRRGLGRGTAMIVASAGFAGAGRHAGARERRDLRAVQILRTRDDDRERSAACDPVEERVLRLGLEAREQIGVDEHRGDARVRRGARRQARDRPSSRSKRGAPTVMFIAVAGRRRVRVIRVRRRERVRRRRRPAAQRDREPARVVDVDERRLDVHVRRDAASPRSRCRASSVTRSVSVGHLIVSRAHRQAHARGLARDDDERRLRDEAVAIDVRRRCASGARRCPSAASASGSRS